MDCQLQIILVLLIATIFQFVAPWYYYCFIDSESTSGLLSDSCSLRGIVVRSDIDARNVYFPPTNINFFQSNFSSFSTTLGRRLPEEAERVNFYNCVAPKFAIPTNLRGLGVYFSNVVTIFANFLADNALEELIIIKAQITSLKFVEVFRNLRFVRIEGNPIEIVRMDYFRNLTKVEVINLSGNRIFFFESVTKPLELPNLTELNLRRNMLVQLDSSLWFSPNLKVLKLHINFLKSLNMDQLHRSFPQLEQVTLGSNLWNCQRLTVIMGAMQIRNISTNDAEARAGCQTFSYVEYLSLSGLDSISRTKQIVEKTQQMTARYSTSEMLNTTLLDDLWRRSNNLTTNLKSLSEVAQRVQTIFSDMKLWIQSKKSLGS